VEAHFTAPSPAGSVSQQDLILAQEMQRRELEAERWREEQEFAALQAQFGMQQDDQGNFAVQADARMRRAVANGELSVTDYYERAAGAAVSSRTGLDDGASRTMRITTIIGALSAKSPGVRVSHVASPPVDHYAATYGDRGWGCGFRNIQMLLSSLSASTHYREILIATLMLADDRLNQNQAQKGNNHSGETAQDAANRMPSIPRLQAAIESAWRHGFDVAGAEQLGYRLTDTRKWIGATEVYTLLTSIGLDVEIVDFHRPTGEGGTHPLLFDWVWNYFSGLAAGSGSPCRPPLYLQHQGHSQTIVGAERSKNGTLKLLILDPSTSPTAIRYSLGYSRCIHQLCRCCIL
jgi:hypothetical protein